MQNQQGKQVINYDKQPIKVNAVLHWVCIMEREYFWYNDIARQILHTHLQGTGWRPEFLKWLNSSQMTDS